MGRFRDFETGRFYQELERQEYDRLKTQTEKLLGTGSLTGSGF